MSRNRDLISLDADHFSGCARCKEAAKALAETRAGLYTEPLPVFVGRQHCVLNSISELSATCRRLAVADIKRSILSHVILSGGGPDLYFRHLSNLRDDEFGHPLDRSLAFRVLAQILMERGRSVDAVDTLQGLRSWLSEDGGNRSAVEAEINFIDSMISKIGGRG